MPQYPPALSSASRQLLGKAATAMQEGHPARAKRVLEELFQQAPGLAEALTLYAFACLMLGDNAKAITCFREALRQRPDDPNLCMGLGSALHDEGASAEALVHLRHACELAPRQASAWYNLGKALKEQGSFDEALDALRHALVLDERHALARVCSADIRTIRGDIDQAVVEYRRVLQHDPGQADAWHALANLKTAPLLNEDAESIRHAMRNPRIDLNTKALLGFSLFRALEDQGDYAGAFQALRAANHCKRRLVSWDAAGEQARIDSIRDAFRQPSALPVDPTRGREVIFVVGLPRSGSTLIEHILASHSQVEGANEIPDLPQVIEEESRRRGEAFPQWVPRASSEDWARLGNDYLMRTARWRESRPRFVDKGLLNWPLVGAALAMLPGAKIINSQRNPIETCFACYRQLFRHGMHFSYDLDEMAAHHEDYQRLMQHWLGIFPGQILTLPLEALVQNPEVHIKRLLEFCGLPFEPACLAPHQTERAVLSAASAAQVRRPIGNNTAHAERYAEFLQELRERLTP